MAEKKKFGELVKGFFSKIVKPVAKGAAESVPIVNILFNLFDTDKDGKLTRKDLAAMEWWKIIGAMAGVGVLIHFGILDLEVFKELINLIVQSLIG